MLAAHDLEFSYAKVYVVVFKVVVLYNLKSVFQSELLSFKPLSPVIV